LALNNFTQRALTGAVYVALTALCTLWRFESALLLFLVVLIASSLELNKILSSNQGGGFQFVHALSCVIVFSFAFINQSSVINAGYFNTLFIGVALLYLFAVIVSSDHGLQRVQTTAISWFYLAIPLGLFLRNGQLELGGESEKLFPYIGWNILIVFVLIWASDTFAYLVGRAIGKRKLAPNISPKKTVEGFLGSLLLTIGLSYFIVPSVLQLSALNSVGLGLVIVIFSTIGDLFESKLKRIKGIKDSGSALPGHGGFLDRFDSVLYAGPASFAYLSAVGMW